MTRYRRCGVLVLASLCGACASAPRSSPRDAPAGDAVVAFLHAAVIPMDTERVLRDQTVVVADGKIAQIGPASIVKVPRGALRIEATGRYLLPALCDMHVHLLGDAWNMMVPPEAQLAAGEVPFEDFLFPFVAEGVTTIEVLSATPDHVALREDIARREVLGPRLILARMVDGPKKAWPPPLSTWVDSAAEAEQAVRQAKEVGYDAIKAYSFLSKESYDAIMATSKELHMDVVGHIPMSLSVEYVLDAGQKLIAHTEEVLKHAGGDYSAEKIDYYARAITEHGTWMTPTLVTTRSILAVFDDSDELMSRPEHAYSRHPMEVGVWSFIADNLYKPIPAATRDRIRDGFERFQKPLTKVFHQHGGRMMTGTDTLLPGLVPGFALHRELRELVDVGLTPYEALRTSTTAPFEFLGESDRAGTIAVGKETDLLLLDENPLEGVGGASRIAGVLIRGRWLPKEEIDARMRRIAEAYARSGGGTETTPP